MPAYRVIEPSGSLGEIQLGVNGSFDSDSTFIYSQSTKRLGIGTSDPQHTLHVVGDALLGDTQVSSFYSTGSATFAGGLSGSLTKLADGTSYLRAGSNVTITTGTNGSVTISSTGGGGGGGSGADPDATYLLLVGTSSLGNSRALSFGSGFSTSDGGAQSNYSVGIDDSVVATLSGSAFSGPVKFLGGVSGSLTSLADGSPFLVSGDNISITTGSGGAVTVSTLQNLSASSITLSGSGDLKTYIDQGNSALSSSVSESTKRRLMYNTVTGTIAKETVIDMSSSYYGTLTTKLVNYIGHAEKVSVYVNGLFMLLSNSTALAGFDCAIDNNTPNSDNIKFSFDLNYEDVIIVKIEPL